MRFLRPDLLRWWLVIPVIVASWAIHWRVMREWRLRSPVAARFAPLSRRSSGRRQAARLLASVATAGALVFALMRPQILLVRLEMVCTQQLQQAWIVAIIASLLRCHHIWPYARD